MSESDDDDAEYEEVKEYFETEDDENEPLEWLLTARHYWKECHSIMGNSYYLMKPLVVLVVCGSSIFWLLTVHLTLMNGYCSTLNPDTFLCREMGMCASPVLCSFSATDAKTFIEDFAVATFESKINVPARDQLRTISSVIKGLRSFTESHQDGKNFLEVERQLYQLRSLLQTTENTHLDYSDRAFSAFMDFRNAMLATMHLIREELQCWDDSSSSNECHTNVKMVEEYLWSSREKISDLQDMIGTLKALYLEASHIAASLQLDMKHVQLEQKLLVQELRVDPVHWGFWSKSFYYSMSGASLSSCLVMGPACLPVVATALSTVAVKYSTDYKNGKRVLVIAESSIETLEQMVEYLENYEQRLKNMKEAMNGSYKQLGTIQSKLNSVQGTVNNPNRLFYNKAYKDLEFVIDYARSIEEHVMRNNLLTDHDHDHQGTTETEITL